MMRCYFCEKKVSHIWIENNPKMKLNKQRKIISINYSCSCSKREITEWMERGWG